MRLSDLKPIQSYLEENYGAVCGYLSGDEFRESLILPNADYQSCLIAAFPYCSDVYCSKIALFARNADYHQVLKEALFSASQCFLSIDYSISVDISPINEVYASVKAGLGVKGLNGLLITNRYGSYVVIGELLFKELINDLPNSICDNLSCLNCKKCIDACPTNHLNNKGPCLSDLTQKKILTPEESNIVSQCGMEWGCDICQLVCPMNMDVEKTKITSFINSEATVDCLEIDNLSNRKIVQKYKERSFVWRGGNVLKRNHQLVQFHDSSFSVEADSFKNKL